MLVINNEILNYLRQNKIPVRVLAEKIHYTRAGLYQLLKTRDMKVKVVYSISKALNHNFFDHVLKSDSANTAEIQALKAENSALNEKLNALKTENEYLKEINYLLKNQKSSS